MFLVVDCSIVIELLAYNSNVIKAIIKNNILFAPDLLNLEILSVTKKLLISSKISNIRSEQLLNDLNDMPIRYISTKDILINIWKIKDNLSIYDASYVIIARLWNIPLFTIDNKLKKSIIDYNLCKLFNEK